MPYSFITHKGKKILFIDYTNCHTPQEMIKLLEQIRELYGKSAEMFLTLNDFTGTVGTTEYINAAQAHKELFDEKTVKTAVLGITGMKKSNAELL